MKNEENSVLLKIFLCRLVICAAFISAGSVFGLAQTKTVPLYRLLVVEVENPNDLFSPTLKDRHFYTTDEAFKKDVIKKYRYEDEGIEGYLAPFHKVKGMKPLYHLVRQKDGKHFYTTSLTEAKIVADTAGYKNMGAIGGVWAQKKEGMLPLFRAYRAGKRDDHFYTTDYKQRNGAVSKHGYVDEGIIGYVYAKPTTIDAEGNAITETQAASISGIDFTTKKRFYINSRKDSRSIETGDKFVNENSQITVKRSETIGCEGDGCRINIGFVASLKNAAQKTHTFASIVSPLTNIGNSYSFAEKLEIKTIMFEVKIKYGQNKIVGTIDTNSNVQEADETNNSFSAVITLIP